ncbi:50S ribosomal protein L10 [Desulfovibrionales bacterium]
MSKDHKAAIIDGLKAKTKNAQVAIVTDFRGLKVDELTVLRAKLRERAIHYQVVKNTLARIAFHGTSYEKLGEMLKDNCAVALGYDDPVTVAKALADYAKTNKKFMIRYGSLQDQLMNESRVVELSKLPGRNELLSCMFNTIKVVPINFVSLLANVPRTFLYALTAIKEQKEAVANT